MNLFTKDSGERIMRAFVTGAIGAATALHLDGGSFIDAVFRDWKVLASAGALATLTTVKSLIAAGRGNDPDSASLKGISTVATPTNGEKVDF